MTLIENKFASLNGNTRVTMLMKDHSSFYCKATVPANTSLHIDKFEHGLNDTRALEHRKGAHKTSVSFTFTFSLQILDIF